MKNKFRVYSVFTACVLLTIFSALAFANNVSAVYRWWRIFIAVGGDTAQVPATCSGIIPWFDWAAVDYSCATTFIPFFGFLLMTVGLCRALAGRRQSSEFFPFFKTYDQLNVALGLVGTLWGIIIIGYYKMDTITMENLMMCLHTALFSTLMAVVWVFLVDHPLARPILRRVLTDIQGEDIEDKDLLDVLERLHHGATGLYEAWDGTRETFGALNQSAADTAAQIRAVAESAGNAAAALDTRLAGSLDAFTARLNAEIGHMDERQKRLDQHHADLVATLGTVSELVGGVQKTQDILAAFTETLAAENANLAAAVKTEQDAANALRTTVAELRGESEGRRKNIDALNAALRHNEDAFNKRLEKLRDEIDALAADKTRLEGDKQSAQRDAHEHRARADKAETMLAKIKSAFDTRQ